jgi:DNA-binding MarR family transcriptional regulator
MTHDQIVAWLEGIIFGGVALTTEGLEYATGGRELSFIQWRAVVLIGNNEDGFRVGQVASFVHAGLPSTSRLLRRLERRGLLTLERDEQDRRATRARLTSAGAELRSSVLAYRRNEISAIVQKVKPASAAERTLRDLAALFDARGQVLPSPSRASADPKPD